jgi:secreted Zn-dependent insulinase-like peptidase
MYERSTPMFMLSFVLEKDYYYEVFTNPEDLICSVFKYGKKNSLSNYLKQEGYILKIECGSAGDIGSGIL